MIRGKYEEALLAALHEGRACPMCGVVWYCGQDVHDRSALLRPEGLTCQRCYEPPEHQVADWLMAHLDELDSDGSALALRVQGLKDDEISHHDLNKAWALMTGDTT